MNLFRVDYQTAMARASYYAWSARKGFAIAGNDPIFGRKRSCLQYHDSAEGRVAYSAMARYWFDVARRRRGNLPALP